MKLRFCKCYLVGQHYLNCNNCCLKFSHGLLFLLTGDASDRHLHSFNCCSWNADRSWLRILRLLIFCDVGAQIKCIQILLTYRYLRTWDVSRATAVELIPSS